MLSNKVLYLPSSAWSKKANSWNAQELQQLLKFLFYGEHDRRFHSSMNLEHIFLSLRKIFFITKTFFQIVSAINFDNLFKVESVNSAYWMTHYLVVCLFLDNDLRNCCMHFARALKSCHGYPQSQIVYLLYYQNYPLLHVWQWNFQYSQEQEPCFLLQIQCFV